MGGSSPATNNSKSSFILFLTNKIAQDAALWLALVVLLGIVRSVMLFWFRAQIAPETSALQIGRAFWTGLRFDACTVSFFTLPLAGCAVLSIFWPVEKLQKPLRSCTIYISAVGLALICPIDIGYFQEYHNQFDLWIWGLVFDDRRAIALTIWKNYPVIWIICGMVALGWGLKWILVKWTSAVGKRWAGRPAVPLHGALRLLAAMILLGAMVLGLRGGIFHRRPIQQRDSAVCGDVFLDKIVINPFVALRYAIRQGLTLSKGSGLLTILPDGDILAAAHALNPAITQSSNLDDYLKRTACGHTNTKPQSIYLIVGESYDAWSLQPKFDALHFCDRVKQLGHDGIMADAFVSAGPGTMPSLAAIICGLPDVGVQTNYREAVRSGVPTAIAPIFERLGYKTRFFYSGYLSWQRLGEFCREQGFDEVYGGADMSEKLSGNEWGVDDRVLFDFILKKSGSEPTFNVIMTTSYHPPFSVDVAAEGFPLRTLPASLAHYHVTPQKLHEFGHLWYSDRCIGRFADQIVAKDPETLVAITGDHGSRRCLETRPSLFEQRAVPFVLFGPQVLAGVSRPEHIAGSHMDILPTLVELAAPKGFGYHAFGRNLLDSTQAQVGFGAWAVITPESISEFDSTAGPERLNGARLVFREQVASDQLRYRQIHALSWWRIMKGSQLPLPKPSPAIP